MPEVTKLKILIFYAITFCMEARTLNYINFIYNGSTFVFLSCFLYYSVYSGHHTYLINPYDLENNSLLWLSTISQHKGVHNVVCADVILYHCSSGHLLLLQCDGHLS